MLSVSKPLNAGQAEKYYQRDNYYLESQGYWYGALATDFELMGKPTNEEDFSAYLRGFTPEGYRLYNLGLDPGDGKLVESAGRKYKDGTLVHRSGVDLTFNCPKSVSILSYSDDRVQEAFQVALRQTLDYVEENYSITRHKKDGAVGFEKTGKCLFSTFQHMTSRELDPHLHAHVIMYNMTKSKNGQIMTTHNDQIYKDQKYLGQHFRNQLALEMQKIGYKVDITDRNKGFFEVRGVEKDIIEAFSIRSEQVRAEMKRLRDLKFCDLPKEQLLRWVQDRNAKMKGDPQYPFIIKSELDALKSSSAHVYASYDDSELATLATIKSRIPKENHTKEFIIERINDVCKSYNTDLEAITNLAKTQEKEKFSRTDAETKIKQAIESITENTSVFRKEDVIQQALKLSIGEYSEKELTKAFETQDIVYLGKKIDTSGVSHVYTSSEMKSVERSIIDICRDSKTSIRVSKEISNAFIDKNDHTLKLNNVLQLRENNAVKANEKFAKILGTINDEHLKHRLVELRQIALEKGNDPSRPTIDVMQEIKNNPSIRDVIEKNGFGFTKGQKDALNQIVSTDCQFSVVQGSAGVGKSFSMKFAKNLLTSSGFKVQGLAPTGKASDELTCSAELANSTTIHDFILRWEMSSKEKRAEIFEKGKVAFILDEAGMVGSRNAYKVMQIAKEIDAKIVFVGDRKQFASIEAGRIFSELQDKAGVDMVVMNDVMRQETQQTKDIVAAISAKDYSAAFNYMQGYSEQLLSTQYTIKDFKKGQLLSFDEESIQVPKGTTAKINDVKDNSLVLEYVSIIDGQSKIIEFDPFEEGEQFRVFKKDDSNGYTNTINVIEDDEKRIDAVTKDYLEYYDEMIKNPKLNAIVITPTNDERMKINTKIRENLVSRNLVQTKGEYTLRESHNLTGDMALFADSYKVGQVFVANATIGNMKRGNEGRITKLDSQHNIMTVEFTDKDSMEKQNLVFNVAEHVGKFSSYNEIKAKLGINDRVTFLKNDELAIDGKKTKVRNGQFATIVDIDEKGNVTARLGKKDTDPQVTFNVNGTGRNQYTYLSSAYCVTDMKSQGGTWNKIIISADSKKNISANSFYVWITRCQEAVSVYVNDLELLKKKASVSQSKDSTLDHDQEFKSKAPNNFYEEIYFQPASVKPKQKEMFEDIHYEPAKKKELDNDPALISRTHGPDL